MYFNRNQCAFTVQGTPIAFDTSDSYSKEWFFPRCDGGKYHEPAVTELVRLLSKEQPSFVDVGAHLGYFTVVAGALMPSSPIISVEMDDRALERLKKNVALNNLTNVQIFHTAISGASGPVSYRRLPMLDSGESISYGHTDDPTVTIQGRTLDKLFAETGIVPGLIKIDVEGADYDVLTGMTQTLTKQPVLLLEIHGKKLPLFGSDSRQVLRFLEDAGYEIFEVGEHRTNSLPRLIPLSSHMEPFDRNTMTIVLPRGHSSLNTLKKAGAL